MKTNKDWEIGQQIMALIADYTPTQKLASVRRILESEVKRNKRDVSMYKDKVCKQQDIIHSLKETWDATDDKGELISLQDQIQTGYSLIHQYRQHIITLEYEARRKAEINRKLAKVIQDRP